MKKYAIILALLFAGCTHGPITAPDLGSALKSNTAIKKNVTTAQTDINQVLKDNAIVARPDLVLKLQDANGQLVEAGITINQQATDLQTKQQQINSAVEQGNAAISALAATVPKHKRDIDALVVAWILCSLACILGPLLLKAYPALIFFPTFLESTVCSLAAFLVCSGVTGLLILVGVL